MSLARRLAVLVVASALVVVAACSGGASGYGKDAEGAFMIECTQRQQQPEALCGCVYTEISQQLPFDRYVEIDKELQKDEKAKLPDDLLRIIADCGSKLQPTTTTTATSLPMTDPFN